MKISRCEVTVADGTDFEDWPILLDRDIAPGELPFNAPGEPYFNVEWTYIRGANLTAGPARISLDDTMVDAPPRYKYEVELSPEDVGALLRRMPIEAVSAVIGSMLRRGQPEVIGAVVGQVVAYLVERVSSRAD